MGWLSVLGTLGGAALGGPLGAAIGGGLGGGVEGANERSRIQKYNEGQSEAMKYAPWTGFSPKFRDNNASLMGGLAQGAAVGALTGGGLQKMFGWGDAAKAAQGAGAGTGEALNVAAEGTVPMQSAQGVAPTTMDGMTQGILPSQGAGYTVGPFRPEFMPPVGVAEPSLMPELQGMTDIFNDGSVSPLRKPAGSWLKF